MAMLTSLAPATTTVPTSAPLAASTSDATTSRVAVASTSSLPPSTLQVPAASSSAASAAPSNTAAGCRLLWRGRLITPSPHNKPLFGIAIVAHLFSFPSSSTSAALPLLSPNQVTAQASPFDDPFAAPGSSSSGADMCLGLEMMRGGDLKVLGEVWVASSAEAQEQEARQKRGKGKGKERETVQVETPTEVRVYVDPRCPETVGWFENWFCREGSEGRGVRVDVGGEEVIVFANLPSLSPPEPTLTSAQGSTSTAPPRPALSLLLGRAIKRPTRAPRPDDPLPRENLFATKLRRTNSLPVLGFDAPPPAPKLGLARGSRTGSSLGAIAELSSSSSATLPSTAGDSKPSRKLKRGSSSRTLMSLMGDEATRKSTTLPRRSSSSSASLPPPPLPPISTSTSNTAPALKKRTLSRTTSSRELLNPSQAASANSYSYSARRPSVAPSHPHPPSDPSNRRGSLKRSRSALLESPVSSDGEEERHRGHSRVPGSPTPSLATTFGGWDDEEELGTGAEEGQDGLVEMKPLFGAAGGKRRGTLSKRSTSEPVGVFELDQGPLRDFAERRRRREATEVPPVIGRGRERREQSMGVGGGLTTAALGASRASREPSVGLGSQRGEREQSVVVETVEGRNKGTIRKIILARLTLRNLTRDDEQFRDVFSMCSKGVQFALRDTYKIKPIDRALATKYADQHIDMYLPASSPSPAAATNPSAQLLSAPPPASTSFPPASLSSTMQEKPSPPTPAPTPTPDVPLITVKQEEGAQPTETTTGPPSTAMEIDAPGAVDVVKKMMVAEEGMLPSPQSLEAREEEPEDSAERGVEIRVESEQTTQQV